MIGFPLLSDDGSKTIRAYGLHFKMGLPHPGTILIDKQGVVRGKLFLEGYRQRHSTEQLLQAAKALSSE